MRKPGCPRTRIMSTNSVTAPADTICPPWSTSLLQDRLDRARAASWRQPSLLPGCKRGGAQPGQQEAKVWCKRRVLLGRVAAGRHMHGCAACRALARARSAGGS